MNVYDIFTKHPKIAGIDTSVADIAAMMRDKNCGSIPIISENKMIGMITDRDIAIRCVAGGLDPAVTKARQIMTPNILYCYEDDSVEAVARNMAENQVRRLPVVNRDKMLTGIVSLGDLSLGCEDDSVCGEALERIRLAP